MSADVLSDVLKNVRLTGAVFFDIAATTPWVAESASRDSILPRILPGAEHMIAYHVVTEGRCFANVIGGEPIPVSAGEVIVFTNGDAHVLSSSPGMRADLALDTNDPGNSGRRPFAINRGSDGPNSAKFVCGYLACDAQPFNPLLQNLPPVIKVGGEERDGDSWFAQFIRVATAESLHKRAGGESVLAKLSELMFIEVVRRYLQSLRRSSPDGWQACAIPSLARRCRFFTAKRRGRGRSRSWRGRAGSRARFLPSASSAWLEFHRCSISPNGGCSSLAVY
jgi:Cupin